MKILYVLKHNPWGRGGGCMASLAYFTAFMEIFRKAETDVCICEEYVKDMPKDFREAVTLYPSEERKIAAKAASAVTGILHRHQKQVLRLLRQKTYDYCIFDHSAVAGTIIGLLPQSTRSIVLNHNFEPLYFRDNNHSLLQRILFLPQVRRNERQSYMNATFNIFLTVNDMRQFEAAYGVSSSKCGCIGMFSSIEFTPPQAVC